MLAIPEPHRDDIFYTTAELASRWNMDAASLANYRSRGEGIPFVKLPTGAVRYRWVDILEAEKAGTVYVSWALIADAMKECPDLKLSDKDVDKVVTFVRNKVLETVTARLKDRTAA